MILKLVAVTFVDVEGLGETAQRPGSNPIEPRKYLLAGEHTDRSEWAGISLAYDTIERLLYVRREGARRPLCIFPAERIARMTPAPEAADKRGHKSA